jgi:cell division septum initiation protein DivIVA
MSTTRTEDGTVAAQATDGVSFPLVVRGYDRRLVDQFVAEQRQALRELAAELSDTEQRLRQATERAAGDAAERQRLRDELAAKRAGAPEGYGARAEKLLRLAESEAADMRANASRESAALMEQARVDAEQHRHEAEQALIARSRELDEEARRREAELSDREQKAAEQVAAGRAEAGRLREAAAESAATLRDEAQAEAELIKARARAEAGRVAEDARVERNRVTELRSEVHAELERIRRMIAAELATETDEAQPDVPEDSG